MDRDLNAARNILDRALNEVGLILSVRGGLEVTQPVLALADAALASKREAFSDWYGIQPSLF